MTDGEGQPTGEKPTDSELARREAEDLKARLAKAEQQNQELGRKYQEDMARMSGHVNQLMAVAQQNVPQQQQVEEDEETRSLRMKIQNAVETTINPYAGQIMQTQRHLQRETAMLKYPEAFQKYGQEIEQLLDAYPPNVSGAPGAYEAAVQAVKAKHVDDIIAERIEAERQKMTSSKTGSLTPQRTAQGRDVPPTDRGEKPWDSLPSGDQEFLQELGYSAEDYNKYNDEKYTEDIFGFKGRDIC